MKNNTGQGTIPNAKAILKAYDFDDSVEQLLELDAELGIVPAQALEVVLQTARQLQTMANEMLRPRSSTTPARVTNREIVDNATALIGAVSSIRKTNVHQFLSRDEADNVHRARNVLLAVILLGSRGTLDKPTAESVCTEFAPLRPRSAGFTRPYEDDEILLLRVWALLLSEVGGKHGRRSAAVYAQCDAGMVPGETTSMRATDVVLEPGNSLLWAPGLRVGVRERVLRLDSFQQHLLSRFAADLGDRDPKASFTYNARGAWKYDAAAASATGVLDRQRMAVGLRHQDTTSSSIPMWRAQYSERHEGGVAAALQVSGRSSAANHRGLMRHRINPSTSRDRRSNKSRVFAISS